MAFVAPNREAGRILYQGAMDRTRAITGAINQFVEEGYQRQQQDKEFNAKLKVAEQTLSTFIKPKAAEFGTTPEAIDAFLKPNPNESPKERYLRIGGFIEQTIAMARMDRDTKTAESERAYKDAMTAGARSDIEERNRKIAQEKLRSETLARVMGGGTRAPSQETQDFLRNIMPEEEATAPAPFMPSVAPATPAAPVPQPQAPAAAAAAAPAAPRLATTALTPPLPVAQEFMPGAPAPAAPQPVAAAPTPPPPVARDFMPEAPPRSDVLLRELAKEGIPINQETLNLFGELRRTETEQSRDAALRRKLEAELEAQKVKADLADARLAAAAKDEVIQELRYQFNNGMIPREEYIERVNKRLEDLVPEDKTGKSLLPVDPILRALELQRARNEITDEEYRVQYDAQIQRLKKIAEARGVPGITILNPQQFRDAVTGRSEGAPGSPGTASGGKPATSGSEPGRFRVIDVRNRGN